MPATLTAAVHHAPLQCSSTAGPGVPLRHAHWLLALSLSSSYSLNGSISFDSGNKTLATLSHHAPSFGGTFLASHARRQPLIVLYSFCRGSAAAHSTRFISFYKRNHSCFYPAAATVSFSAHHVHSHTPAAVWSWPIRLDVSTRACLRLETSICIIKHSSLMYPNKCLIMYPNTLVSYIQTNAQSCIRITNQVFRNVQSLIASPCPVHKQTATSTPSSPTAVVALDTRSHDASFLTHPAPPQFTYLAPRPVACPSKLQSVSPTSSYPVARSHPIRVARRCNTSETRARGEGANPGEQAKTDTQGETRLETRKPTRQFSQSLMTFRSATVCTRHCLFGARAQRSSGRPRRGI